MRRSVWMALGASALWVACSGALFSIRVEDTSTTSVPAASPVETVLGDMGFGGFSDMDITSHQELQNQGVQEGDITSVTFREFTLEAISPQGADLSFIDQIDFYVEAPGFDQVLIATQDEFPEGESLVELELPDVDIVDYVLSEEMTITTDVTGSRPDEETEVEGFFALRIGVTGQGCQNYQQQQGAVAPLP